MMMSASLSASALTVAPAAVNSASGRPDLMPAPGSMAISAPNALNFFTVSGEAATRGSNGSISLATAIFMRPPARMRARAFKGRDVYLLQHDAWSAIGFSNQVKARRRGAGGRRATLNEENSHQDDDQGNADRAVLHQLDE